MRFWWFLHACVWMALPVLSLQAAGRFAVQIEEGHSTESIVMTAPVPPGFPDFPESGLLEGEGVAIPFQKTQAGEVTWVLPPRRAGGSMTLAVRPHSPGTAHDQNRGARAERIDGRIEMWAVGRKIFEYQGKETRLPRPEIDPIYRRGGYLHPVFSPSGRMVTDDYPTNHVHHHGIWFPWTKTVFDGRTPDFWNMGEGKGRVEFVEFGSTWSGSVQAGLAARHRFVDLTSGQPVIALQETWSVMAYAVPGADYNVFDLISTQTCASATALHLPKYHYGGLGVRGHGAWDGAAHCQFLTSNGETDRLKGNETRGQWCYLGGLVEGAQAGLAILGHPENFRAPQPMRLHPSEPFFCFAPSQMGDWAIEPGKAYVSRYRFLIFDGAVRRERLDALWKAYAQPPQTSIVAR